MVLIRILKRLLITGVLVFAATMGALVWQSMEMFATKGEGAHLPPSDVTGLVLGGGIKTSGILELTARRRVHLGVKLLQEGKVGRLMMAGGTMEAWHEPIGVVMARLAESLGAPPEALLAEKDSMTTFENMLYSEALLAKTGDRRVIIVTDSFHMPRSKVLARITGLDVIDVAAMGDPAAFPVETWHRIWLREAAAWWVNVLRVGYWQLSGQTWRQPVNG